MADKLIGQQQQQQQQPQQQQSAMSICGMPYRPAIATVVVGTTL